MNTNNWKLDLFSSLDSACSLQSILNASLAAVRPFGFDFCGWRTTPTKNATDIVAMNAIEDEVYKTIFKGGYDEAPVPCHCAHSMNPISWRGTSDDTVFVQSPEMMEEYYGLGHRGGWAIATTSPEGTRGMFYVESQHSFTPSEMDYAEQHMQWVSAAAYMRIIEIKDVTQIILSDKEKQLLQAISQNNGDIIKAAEQIGINLPSALRCIKYMKKKFECKDIHSLISRAMFLRLIS